MSAPSRKRPASIPADNRSKSLPGWVVNGTTVVLVYVLASLAVFTYERALTPLYACHPTQFLLNKVLFAAIGCAAVSPTGGRRRRKSYLLAPVLLAVAPVTSYLVASRTARWWRDPFWGPAVVHVLVLFPIVFALTDLAVVVMEVRMPSRCRSFSWINTMSDLFFFSVADHPNAGIDGEGCHFPHQTSSG